MFKILSASLEVTSIFGWRYIDVGGSSYNQIATRLNQAPLNLNTTIIIEHLLDVDRR